MGADWENLVSGNNSFVAINENNVMTGYILIGPPPFPFCLNDELVGLWSIVVVPEYIKRGIGTQLIDYAKAELDDDHCFVVSCREKNLEFYQKNGFILHTKDPGYYDDGDTGYILYYGADSENNETVLLDLRSPSQVKTEFSRVVVEPVVDITRQASLVTKNRVFCSAILQSKIVVATGNGVSTSTCTHCYRNGATSNGLCKSCNTWSNGY
jgi:hypothetical protein